MLSLLTIASLLLSLGASVRAESVAEQEQQLQVIEVTPLVAVRAPDVELLEKCNHIPDFSKNESSTLESQSSKRPNNVAILQPDGQWHRFVFGKAGSTVRLKFVFNLRAPALLDITDLFCPGDAFRLIDNGKNIGRTPLKRADGCKVKTPKPEVAFASDKWSHRSFELGKGKHEIEIQVIRSPYCGGAGAIRLNPILYTCLSSESGDSCSSEPVRCSSTSEPVRCSSSSEPSVPCESSSEHQRPERPCGEFTVITSKVPFGEAEQACRALGLKLANLTNENFLAATEAAFRCSGDFSQTWIKSWYGDTYQNSCLVLSTGATAPGGAINVPNSCCIELPVVCQRCEEGDESCERQLVEHSECGSSESERPDSEDCHNIITSCSEEEEEEEEEKDSEKCDKSRPPFTILPHSVPFCEAAAACKREGLELANLNNANFLTATTIAFRELGADRQSWVGSWNGDDYEGTSIALSTGSNAPGGSINHPDGRDTKLPVLCQKRFRENHY